MRKLRLLLSFLLLYIFFLTPICLAFNDDFYIWSNNPSTISTSSNLNDSTINLNLESESAILIEQTTRKNII